jgi:transcriptional regulator with GAF, ATPase, and Fis domain
LTGSILIAVVIAAAWGVGSRAEQSMTLTERVEQKDWRVVREIFVAHSLVDPGQAPRIAALTEQLAELERSISSLAILDTSTVLVWVEDLPDQLKRTETSPGNLREQVLAGRKSLGEAVDEFEREIIAEALQQTEFNQTRAAEMLGTTRRILKYRMDKLGIDAPER